MAEYTVNRSIRIRPKELEPYFDEYHEFLDDFSKTIDIYPKIDINDKELELYDCISLTIYNNILRFVLENKDVGKLFGYDVVTEDFKNRVMNFLINPYIKYLFIYDMYNQYYLFIIINGHYLPIREFLNLVKDYRFKKI